MGGDLFRAGSSRREVFALNSSGRAGSGADAAELRAEGRTEMPFRHDIRTVTVPGWCRRWMALHERSALCPSRTCSNRRSRSRQKVSGEARCSSVPA
jgi:gamma-glutamyltranspeptidase/glutathione hydrolase